MTAEQFVCWIGGYLALSSSISNRECIVKGALDKLSPIEFCYFLNGFFECSNETMTKSELIMQDHLALVFNKSIANENEKTNQYYYDESGIYTEKMWNAVIPSV